MRTRRPLSAVIAAKNRAEHAGYVREQSRDDAIERSFAHVQKDWPAIFAEKRAAQVAIEDAPYKERLASYASDEPDGTWEVGDVLRWNRERGVSLPSPGDLEISAEQDAMAVALAGAVRSLPPDRRWKPTETTPVLNADPETAPRASRELADRVTRYFEDNPRATYRQAANDLNISSPAITGAKRRVLEECTLTGNHPPAWATRSKGWRQRPDAHVRLMSNDELLAAMKDARDSTDE